MKYKVRVSSEVTWDIVVESDCEEAAMKIAEEKCPNGPEVYFRECITEAHGAELID